jgi:hypothetical protein
VVVDDKFVGMVRTPELAAIAAVLARSSRRRWICCRASVPVRAAAAAGGRGALAVRRPGAAHRGVDPPAGRRPQHAGAGQRRSVRVRASSSYAFGWSTLRDRLGVVGFSRLDPAPAAASFPDEVPGVMLRRGLRVAVHEVGHMFGLGHCQAFRCMMNGISDLEELDATPLRLCPLCLRKLHLVTGLDPRARDAALLRVFAGLGLAEETDWLAARARHLWPALATRPRSVPR